MDEKKPEYLQRKLNKNDSCPICLDVFADKKTIQCEQCGNFIHHECLNEKFKNDIKCKKTLECIYCRKKMEKC